MTDPEPDESEPHPGPASDIFAKRVGAAHSTGSTEGIPRIDEGCMQGSATQGAYLLRIYDRWLSGLDDDDRAWAPDPGSKTAGWLVGHLAVTGDFGRRLCGLGPLAPKEWRAAFSPGTVPNADPGAYPPMVDLVTTFRAVYADLVASAPRAAPDVLAVPNPYEPARDAFPTAGAFVEYLLTGHLAYHLGQLSVWRAVRAAAALRRGPA